MRIEDNAATQPQVAAEPQWDAFVSYNHSDVAAVREIANTLRSLGVSLWFDEWMVKPGDNFVRTIQAAMDRSRTVIVVVGPNGSGQSQEGEFATAHRAGSRIVPIKLPGGKGLPWLVGNINAIDLSDGAAEAQLQRLARTLIEVAENRAPAGACPYRGLRFFDVDDAALFFGREEIVAELLESIRPAPLGRGQRSIALVGDSGTGKSSLARAGILAAIESGAIEAGDRWGTVACTPGSLPLSHLALALKARYPASEPDSQGLRDRLHRDRTTLDFVAREITGVPSNGRLVLLIDQLEEVFGPSVEASDRDAFIDNLCFAANRNDSKMVLILTIRADFLGACAAYEDFARLISSNQRLIGPLNKTEIRRAIELPAQKAGYVLQDGLVDLLIQDGGMAPGMLPQLQDLLVELWKHRSERVLTVASYRQAGGLKGALNRRAEAIYTSMSEPEKQACRKVFLRLAVPTEFSAGMRERLRFDELVPATGDVSLISSVVEQLSNERLITIGRGDAAEERTIELAHEALMQSWDRLRSWLDEDRISAAGRRRLAAGAAEWQANERHESYLWRGKQLKATCVWADDRLSDLNRLERDFLYHSIISDSGSDLKNWMDRYGDGPETIALAEQYVLSSTVEHRKRGLAVLGAITRSDLDDAVNLLLFTRAVKDESMPVREEALGLLERRRPLDWFTNQLARPDITRDEVNVVLKVLGRLRNDPGSWVFIQSATPRRYNRRLRLYGLAALAGKNGWALTGVLFSVFTGFHIARFVIARISGLFGSNGYDPLAMCDWVTVLVALACGVWACERVRTDLAHPMVRYAQAAVAAAVIAGALRLLVGAGYEAIAWYFKLLEVLPPPLARAMPTTGPNALFESVMKSTYIPSVAFIAASIYRREGEGWKLRRPFLFAILAGAAAGPTVLTGQAFWSLLRGKALEVTVYSSAAAQISAYNFVFVLLTLGILHLLFRFVGSKTMDESHR